MKNFNRMLLIITCSFITNHAENIDLIFKAEMVKNNGKDHLTLFSQTQSGNSIEGFFFLPQYEPTIDGAIREGGFSFLDPKIFDVAYGAEKLRKEWVKNDFPVLDIENLTNGINLEKILSFYIIPEIKTPVDDSITLFIKYSVYNLQEKERQVEWNLNFDIKLFYKKIKVPFGRELSFSFINEHFEDYHFLFWLERENNFYQNFNLQDGGKFFEGIEKTIEESVVKDKFNIALSAEFVQLQISGKMWGDFYSGLELRNKQVSLLPAKLFKDEQSMLNLQLPLPVYTARLNFPFKIYNDKKGKEYSAYKTVSKILNSVCNIVIVPISLNDDSLTADLFIDYSKLNTGNIPRWTPVKKRITIHRGSGIKIDLPKENWTANFVRDGERYDIYGYSDFEKFINEYLIITLNSIETHR